MPRARRSVARPAPAGAGPRRRAGRPGGKPVKAKSPAADNASGTRSGGFELAELRRLIDLVQSTGIGELDLTTGGRTIAGVRVSPSA